MFPRHGRLLVGLCGFFFFSIVLYWYALPAGEGARKFGEAMDERIEELRQRLHANEQLIGQLKQQVSEERKKFARLNRNLDQPSDEEKMPPIPPPKYVTDPPLKGNKVQNMRGVLKAATCPSRDLVYNSTADVQMLNVYEMLKFDNPDGGVWKQGWDVEYDPIKVQEEEQLKVFIVPHSHNDPGWQKTFEDYYSEDTRKIFNYMYKHLKAKTDMKFIYAEMSFFELWWSEISKEVREDLKKMAERGQLEIVTGGWVMTDEANANYFAIIMELIEGHEFLQNQLGYTPKNHLSIDPFGLSSTLPYLMNRANFSNMAVNRVHYAVKKYLARNKKLEFYWRQLFARDSITDIVTNMFPFFSYDIPHTCGPDPKICCQFDFRRLKAFGCPWGKAPLVVTDANVAERAQLLADQYRKKAQLYGTNTVLIPLGDDFRYDTEDEWTDQYTNYKKLIEYINEKREWNMQVQFGTLDDYFTAMRSRLNVAGELAIKGKWNLPVLSGDFFTYADRDDHYWSGYFTSRPFYKNMDRTLEHYLRSADVLLSLAFAKSMSGGGEKFPGDGVFDDLVEARRALSLFQHHDAVAGTARAFVVQDYAQKMLNAINKCKVIIAIATQYLAKLPTSREDALKVDEEHSNDTPPEKIVSEDGSTLIVFNSLAQVVEEVVCVLVNSDKSRVSEKSSRKEVPQQIGPVFYVDVNTNNIQAHKNKFELCFSAVIPPLGFLRYKIFEADDTSHKASVEMSSRFAISGFDAKPVSTADNICLTNSNLKACFNQFTGFLMKMGTKSGEFPIDLSFITYNPRGRQSNKPGDSLSGAYLFLPDGPATTLTSERNEFVVVKGAVRQYVFIKGYTEHKLQQIVSLAGDTDSLFIENTIDLSNSKSQRERLKDVEVGMRLKWSSDSASDEKFFTDLNGFQMIRRRRFDKLPIQAQFYPMSAAAFVEDKQKRVTLLSRQALGVSNLEPGTLEVMLDRRLSSDDDRGMAEGVLDSRQTTSKFKLFVEAIDPAADKIHSDGETTGYHSLAVNHAQLVLNYPPTVMTGQVDGDSDNADDVPNVILDSDFPCDVHLVALRTISQPTVYGSGTEADPLRRTAPANSIALILHRVGSDCRLASNSRPSACRSNTYGEVDLTALSKNLHLKSAQNTSLTLLYKSAQSVDNFRQNLQPMEIRTVQLNL